MPRAIFFILRFAEPRGTVRFALGAAFLRAVRFAVLRSSLLSVFVFAIDFQSERDVVGIATTIVMASRITWFHLRNPEPRKPEPTALE